MSKKTSVIEGDDEDGIVRVTVCADLQLNREDTERIVREIADGVHGVILTKFHAVHITVK